MPDESGQRDVSAESPAAESATAAAGAAFVGAAAAGAVAAGGVTTDAAATGGNIAEDRAAALGVDDVTLTSSAAWLGDGWISARASAADCDSSVRSRCEANFRVTSEAPCDARSSSRRYQHCFFVVRSIR